MQRRYSIAFFMTILLVAAAHTAFAQASNLNGTFTLNRQASDDVNRAIETAVSRMSFVTRPIARGRLRREHQTPQRVVIAHSAKKVSVTYDVRQPIETPDNGQPVKWTREDGEKFDVSTEINNGKLEQTFRAEDGSTTRTFTISPDGRTLTMQVTARSPRMPQPLSYKLVYNRAS